MCHMKKMLKILSLGLFFCRITSYNVCYTKLLRGRCGRQAVFEQMADINCLTDGAVYRRSPAEPSDNPGDCSIILPEKA